MPLYSNVPVCVRRGKWYKNGGYAYRRCRPPKDTHHAEVYLYASLEFARQVGNVDMDANTVYDDYTITVTDYAGPTLSIKERKRSGRYTMISLILYTIGASDEVSNRTDAVLVRQSDARYVEVLSGGGYNKSGRRIYDNIVLRAACAYKRVIAIQRDKSYRNLRGGDMLFIITKDGVEKIALTKDNINDVLSSHNLSLVVKNWQYI